LDMLQAAVLAKGAFETFREFIWCGYGEPTYRLDLIRGSAPWLRSRGAVIRLNTNGHASLIHGRDVLPELAQAVDDVSVSLNAPNCQRYLELCHPLQGALAWDATLDFLARAPAYFKSVQASVVGFVLAPEEIESCRLLALSLGVRQFRVR
jgi:TatD family-associated radical SAM protein